MRNKVKRTRLTD